MNATPGGNLVKIDSSEVIAAQVAVLIATLEGLRGMAVMEAVSSGAWHKAVLLIDSALRQAPDRDQLIDASIATMSAADARRLEYADIDCRR